MKLSRLFFLGLLVMFGCKPKQVFVASVPDVSTIPTSTLTAEKLIASQEALSNTFQTLSTVSEVKYEGNGNAYALTAEIKLKKDEMLGINVRFMGIIMAKALITPQGVKYYEKAQSTYFDGDFETLSQWMGTDLNFSMIQNLILGKSLVNLSVQDYNFETTETEALLISKNQSIKTSFSFSIKDLLLIMQSVQQPQQNKAFEISYQERVVVENSSVAIPRKISITATQKNEKHAVDLQHQNIKFNEEITFPYNVPNGYERIYTR